MAVFATDAVVIVESAGALGEGNIQRMARQTFRGRFRMGQTENFPHSLANWVSKHFKCFGVLIFYYPGAVFVL